MNTQQVEMDKKFGAVHRAVAMLDKFSHPLPQRLREQFNAAPHRSAQGTYTPTCIYIHVDVTFDCPPPALPPLPHQMG